MRPSTSAAVCPDGAWPRCGRTPAGTAVGGARHLNRHLFIQHQFLVEARVVARLPARPPKPPPPPPGSRRLPKARANPAGPMAESGRRCRATSRASLSSMVARRSPDLGGSVRSTGWAGPAAGCSEILLHFGQRSLVSRSLPGPAPRYWRVVVLKNCLTSSTEAASRSSMEPITE